MMMVIAITEKGEKKMPFIDEDRLYENIEEKYKFAQGEARKAYSDVLDTICEMPSADAQEVRHGRFELIGKNVSKCTACGFERNIKTQFGWSFCPNCGCKLDNSGDV